MIERFFSDEERGIDRTKISANDCSRFNNAPARNRIPDWWLFSQPEDTEGLIEVVKQLITGQATLEQDFPETREQILMLAKEFELLPATPRTERCLFDQPKKI